jgi:hypothetical protein
MLMLIGEQPVTIDEKRSEGSSGPAQNVDEYLCKGQ